MPQPLLRPISASRPSRLRRRSGVRETRWAGVSAEPVPPPRGSGEPVPPASAVPPARPAEPLPTPEGPTQAGPTQDAVAPPPLPRKPSPRSLELDDDELAAAMGGLGGGAGELDKLLLGEQSAEVELESRRLATVVKVDQESAFFSLGSQYEGIAPLRQFAEVPQVGDQLEVVVSRFLPEDGLYELLVPGASVDVADWSDLTEGIVVEALVTGQNSGGLECEVNHIRGFMPISQVSLYRVEDLSEFVGQRLSSVVTEANPQRRNLVLSHRALLEREKEAARAKLLEELDVGQIREGVVRNIKDFGAFVDLGGVDGLIHISQLSWDRVGHPSEVLEVGQK